MPKRAEQCLSQAVFVPWSFVSATVEEEGGRHDDAARGGARGVSLHPHRRGSRDRHLLESSLPHDELALQFLEIVLGENGATFHERVMYRPEFAGALEHPLR